MTYWTRRFFTLHLLSASLTRRSLFAQGSEAILRRMAEAYRNDPGFRMECIVNRMESQPLQETWRKTQDRRYRVYLSRDSIRVDLLGDNQAQTTRPLTPDRAVQYSSVLRQYVEGKPSTLPEVVEQLNRSRGLFYQRFVELPEFQPTVAPGKQETISAGKQKIACQRVKIQSGDGQPSKWTGELWIDAASALVWRSKLRITGGPNQVDEEIRWLTVEPCADCSEEIASWKPPEEATRVERFVQRLPQ